MSRKKATFSQLIDYIQKGASHESRHYYHNTYSQDTENLKREFSENARYLKARKNGVYLYHEILSIKRSRNLSSEEQQEKLSRIIKNYLAARAPRQLAFGMLHDDHAEHLHCHLVISANKVNEAERVRLSKKQFADIQTQLERHVLEHFPELEQQAVFSPNQTKEQRAERKAQARISNQGAELKRRTGKTARRDQVKNTLEDILNASTTPREFSEAMNKAGFTFYQRGQYAGIEHQGKKYRFATLGLAEDWQHFDEKMTASMKPPNHTQAEKHTVPIHPEAQEQENAQHRQRPEAQQSTEHHQQHEKTQQQAEFGEAIAETVNSAKEELKNLSGFQVDEAERTRRLEAMKTKREQAKRQEDQHQSGQGYKPRQ